MPKEPKTETAESQPSSKPQADSADDGHAPRLLSPHELSELEVAMIVHAGENPNNFVGFPLEGDLQIMQHPQMPGGRVWLFQTNTPADAFKGIADGIYDQNGCLMSGKFDQHMAACQLRLILHKDILQEDALNQIEDALNQIAQDRKARALSSLVSMRTGTVGGVAADEPTGENGATNPSQEGGSDV